MTDGNSENRPTQNPIVIVSRDRQLNKSLTTPNPDASQGPKNEPTQQSAYPVVVEYRPTAINTEGVSRRLLEHLKNPKPMRPEKGETLMIAGADGTEIAWGCPDIQHDEDRVTAWSDKNYACTLLADGATNTLVKKTTYTGHGGKAADEAIACAKDFLQSNLSRAQTVTEATQIMERALSEVFRVYNARWSNFEKRKDKNSEGVFNLLDNDHPGQSTLNMTVLFTDSAGKKHWLISQAGDSTVAIFGNSRPEEGQMIFPNLKHIGVDTSVNPGKTVTYLSYKAGDVLVNTSDGFPPLLKFYYKDGRIGFQYSRSKRIYGRNDLPQLNEVFGPFGQKGVGAIPLKDFSKKVLNELIKPWRPGNESYGTQANDDSTFAVIR